MHKNNETKNILLGMPHGTANGILRKNIIFWLAGKSDMLNCFRCGKLIEDINEFSIEHKRPWQREPEPKEAFFDIDNISFSHIKCNVDARNLMKTHCPKGHPYNGSVSKRGWKVCHVCHRITEAKYKRKKYTTEKRHSRYIRTGN